MAWRARAAPEGARSVLAVAQDSQCCLEARALGRPPLSRRTFASGALGGVAGGPASPAEGVAEDAKRLKRGGRPSSGAVGVVPDSRSDAWPAPRRARPLEGSDSALGRLPRSYPRAAEGLRASPSVGT